LSRCVGYKGCPITSVPAADVDGAVLDHVQKLLAAPELVARTGATAQRGDDGITEREVTVWLPDAATICCSPSSRLGSCICSSSGSRCGRTHWRCGSGPRDWRAWSGSCGKAKGWRHDRER
jgi:hypothetical protein